MMDDFNSFKGIIIQVNEMLYDDESCQRKMLYKRFEMINVVDYE